MGVAPVLPFYFYFFIFLFLSAYFTHIFYFVFLYSIFPIFIIFYNIFYICIYILFVMPDSVPPFIDHVHTRYILEYYALRGLGTPHAALRSNGLPLRQ